jgi:hypothetical protein
MGNFRARLAWETQGFNTDFLRGRTHKPILN